jgi:hypothetical protein
MLACFAVEPQLLDDRLPWFCNVVDYRFDVDGYSVLFSVTPNYPDIRILVRRGERRLFEFNLRAVRDVRIIDESEVDAVEVIIDGQSKLRLQLRPVFEITQEFTAEGLTKHSV